MEQRIEAEPPLIKDIKLMLSGVVRGARVHSSV